MKFLITLFFAGLFCGISAKRLNTDWWKNTEVYDIVIAAFKDQDSDGFGDFEGITSKLDYIKSLGVGCIKLSQISASTDAPSEVYPIEDFKSTHMAFGTLEDFDTLVQLANAKGIQVILDININSVSVDHEWFKKSENRIEPYTDYFIWSNAEKNDTYFENSVSGVWGNSEVRKQQYFRRNNDETADLNLNNEAVKKEIKDVLKFWLDRGISGFNLLSASTYVKDDKTKDYEYPLPSMVEGRAESYEFIHELRVFLDDYNKKNGGYERILMTEYQQIEKYPNLRGTPEYPIVHVISKPFFDRNKWWDRFLYVNSLYITQTITKIMQELKNGPTMLILEDSSLTRIANKFQDRQYLDVWLTTIFMLPGINHIYYGQEIGISNWKFAYESKITAMHWDDSINAGFTSGDMSPYSPNVDYWKVNVNNLKKAKYSTLKSIKDLLKVRKTKAVQLGDLKTYELSEYVFAFSRSYGSEEKIIIVLNLSNVLHTINLKRDIPEAIPQQLRVVSSSPNSIHRTGDEIKASNNLDMRPVSSTVFSVK